MTIPLDQLNLDKTGSGAGVLSALATMAGGSTSHLFLKSQKALKKKFGGKPVQCADGLPVLGSPSKGDQQGQSLQPEQKKWKIKRSFQWKLPVPFALASG